MSVVFLGAITLPLAGLLFGLDSSFVLEENRSPAPRPALEMTRAALVEFPSKFEAFFNDHFGFRKRLIHCLSLAKVACLGVSSSPNVIVGGGGWLYFGGHAPSRIIGARAPSRAINSNDIVRSSSQDATGWRTRSSLPLRRHAQQGVDLPRVHAERL